MRFFKYVNRNITVTRAFIFRDVYYRTPTSKATLKCIAFSFSIPHGITRLLYKGNLIVPEEQTIHA